MPRLLYDFKCDACGTVDELFVDTGLSEGKCSQCGRPSKRIISPVRCNLDPISGDFPGATEKWANDRMKKMRQEPKDSAFCSKEGTIMRDDP